MRYFFSFTTAGLFGAGGLRLLLMVALNAAISGETPGQTLSNPCAPEPGGANPLSWSGEYRLRYESRQNYDFIYNREGVDGRSDNDDNFLLHRFRLNLDYHPNPYLQAHVTVQDAREFGSHQLDHDDLDDRFINIFENRTDLHEAWLKLKLGECPLWVQVGRQYLSYGDQRLLGAFDWSNTGRTFDAVKLIYEQGDFKLDLFAGNVVLVDSNAWDNPDHSDNLLGAYATLKNRPYGTHDFYLLYRDNDDLFTELYTLGTRIDGKREALDWNFESAYQWGSSTDRVALRPLQRNEFLSHQAFALHGELGWTCKNLASTPRLGLEYNFATGDDDPNDGENNTFDNLFPTNHLFYGYMDFFSWKNMHNPAVKLSWKCGEKLSFKTHWHFFWLDEESQDAWYNAGGGVVRNGAGNSVSSYVGNELDLVASYKATEKWQVELGYGHFFAEDYVADTAPAIAGADDADFVYVMSKWTF
ncbi:MAG: alginate export family protein [Candidatus Omnitrophica bacterium]|nr:alginate export family protein [Candidatus Omnitrophota bacterium]